MSERLKLGANVNPSSVSQKRQTIENVLGSPIHLPDVRQEGEGEEEPRHKTADVCKVVDPREQAKGEEKRGDGRQLGKRSPRPLKDLPSLKKLHKQTGQDAKLAACRTNLRTKRLSLSVVETHGNNSNLFCF